MVKFGIKKNKMRSFQTAFDYACHLIRVRYLNECEKYNKLFASNDKELNLGKRSLRSYKIW